MPDHANPSTALLDRDWLAGVRETIADAAGVIVCLDFDGTLAPIVEDPDDAAILPDNLVLLRQLAASPSVTVAVVSGRSLADLRDRVPVEGIHYAGNHGLEWHGPDGRMDATDAQEGNRVLAETAESIRSRLAGIPGYAVEEKGPTATVHYRLVPESVVPTVIETTHRIVDATDGLEYRPGKQIIDIRPTDLDGKGRIIDRLRERHPDAAVVVVGDDVTDEDAFRAAEPEGFGVLVGDREETAASVRVPHPDGVTMLLAWLVATVGSPATQPTA